MTDKKKSSKDAVRNFEIPNLVVVPASSGVSDLIAVLPNRANLWDKTNEARVGLRLSQDQLEDIEAHSIGSVNVTIACLLSYAISQLRRNKEQLQISRTDTATKKLPIRKKKTA